MISMILDTETDKLPQPTFADLSAQPHIIEIGIVLVEDGKIIEEYSQMVNPGVQLTEERMKMHGGFTNEILAQQPRFSELVPKLRALAYKALEIIGHNVTFDCDILKYELRRAECDYFPFPEMVDTVHEFKHMFGYNPKLIELYEKIVGVPLNQTHRALDDAKAVYEILKKYGWWAS